MIDFSVRTFKEYLKKPLERQEITFLIRTFSRSCFYFAFLMIFILSAGLTMQNFLGRYFFMMTNVAVMIVCGLLFFFFSLKYRLDPLGVSQSTIAICWTTMTLVFTSLFLTLINFCFGGSDVSKFAGNLILWGVVVFGVTIALYTIPVFVGLYIQNKKTIISLVKFLRICGILYIVFLLASLVCSVLWYHNSERGLSSLGLIPFTIYVIFVFLSPIVTIYRLKSIAPYINYEDDNERRRWQNFFVFEIVEELLHMAYTVARFLASHLSRGPWSRLG